MLVVVAAAAADATLQANMLAERGRLIFHNFTQTTLCTFYSFPAGRRTQAGPRRYNRVQFVSLADSRGQKTK